MELDDLPKEKLKELIYEETENFVPRPQAGVHFLSEEILIFYQKKYIFFYPGNAHFYPKKYTF